MIEWLLIETAPRNGTWILVDVDDGRNDCNEDDTPWKPNCCLGRFNPKFYAETGVTYDWEVLDAGEWNHWADGRVVYWQPLPENPPRLTDR